MRVLVANEDALIPLHLDSVWLSSLSFGGLLHIVCQPQMIRDHTRAQRTPLGTVFCAPAWTLQDEGEGDSHELAYDDAQSADTPLVGLVVGHGHGHPQSVGEVVKVLEMAQEQRRQGLYF